MIRRRSDTERAIALLRRLDAPRKRGARKRREGYVWPSRAEIENEFRAARRLGR
jgi:hypothetical protein